MKKKSIQKICGLLLIVVMAFAFAACGDSDGVDTQTSSDDTEITEATDDLDPATVDDPEFDIMEILEAAGLNEALPSDVDYSIEKDSHTSVTIYHNEANADGFTGNAGTIEAYDQDDNSYEILPDYTILGVKYGIQFVLNSPTDVRFNPEDQEQGEEYTRLYDALKAFRVN